MDMAYPITLSINLNVLILHQSHIFMKKKRVMRALVELAVLKTRHLVEPAVVLFGSRQLVLWHFIKASYLLKDRTANLAKTKLLAQVVVQVAVSKLLLKILLVTA